MWGAMSPHYDFAYFELGRIYEKLGDNDKAVHNYELLLTKTLYTKNMQTYQFARARDFSPHGKIGRRSVDKRRAADDAGRKQSGQLAGA